MGPVAQKVGGKGGGRPDLAEAGGKDAGGAGLRRWMRCTASWSRCWVDAPCYLSPVVRGVVWHEVLEERIRWSQADCVLSALTHGRSYPFHRAQGQADSAARFLACRLPTQMQLLLEYVRVTVAKHGRANRCVTLADFTEREVDHAVAMRIKEVLTLDRPFVKKTAWVGTESIPHAFYGELPHLFPARNCDVQDARRSDGLAGGSELVSSFGICNPRLNASAFWT